MAKVIFAWPPMANPKGFATIGQNRQFQWFKDPTFIYPITSAIGATMLAKAGHKVQWLDSIAEELGEVDFAKPIVKLMPDYIVFEANTPVIERYWEIIDGIKENFPTIKIILCGSHVTALPDESREKCKADYIVQGGKWHKKVFKIIQQAEWEGDLPRIDRNLTRWWLYAYKNGNFKYTPGTYIMAAQDCWHRPGCTFCSWADYHPEYEARPVEDVLSEIEFLMQMGFKEIFDDSGTFPTGEWLQEFCAKVKEREYPKYISLGCNMRFGSLEDGDFKAMEQAGFRMVLWGLESVNQETLDKLNKGYKVQDVSRDLIRAKGAGLQSHLTCMFGYPFETYEEARATYKMVKYFLTSGYAFSAQATICIPYPGTPLWKHCKENNLLTTEQWNEYDMTKAVMKIPYSEKKLFALQRGIYNTAFDPRFLWHKIKIIRCMDDLRYYLRIGKKIYDRFGNFYCIHKATED